MQIRVEFPPVWAIVRRLREGIKALMDDSAPELVHAVVLAAAELGENVVKYGEYVPGLEESTVDVQSKNGCVRVVTVNGVVEERHLKNVQDIVQQLKNCDEPKELYEKALAQMLDDGSEETWLTERGPRIGLLRVAAEAGFELDCDYEQGQLTITATRRL